MVRKGDDDRESDSTTAWIGNEQMLPIILPVCSKSGAQPTLSGNWHDAGKRSAKAPLHHEDSEFPRALKTEGATLYHSDTVILLAGFIFQSSTCDACLFCVAQHKSIVTLQKSSHR